MPGPPVNLVIASALGVPGGALAAFLLTPLLWRFEPKVHMELAGHSGPAGTVIAAIIFITTFMIFITLCLIQKFRQKT